MDIKDKKTSAQASLLLERLHEQKLTAFTTDQAYHALPETSEIVIKRLLGKMTSRGLLMRVKEGLYHIIPYEQDAKTFMPDWHLLAQYLVGDAKYYIGYFSAMAIHSLTTQPALKEQIVVSKQIKPTTQRIKDIPFQFIYHNDEHFFGEKKTWIDSYNRVICSDLEKTIIDSLFKPSYAGGITEIVKAIAKSKDKINYQKLYEYAKKFNSQAVIKRLGFLLELLEINHPAIEMLQRLRTNSFVLLEPGYPKEGKTISRWAIQQNIDTESILSPIYT